jgi:hypothetical protein
MALKFLEKRKQDKVARLEKQLVEARDDHKQKREVVKDIITNIFSARSEGPRQARNAFPVVANDILDRWESGDRGAKREFSGVIGDYLRDRKAGKLTVMVPVGQEKNAKRIEYPAAWEEISISGHVTEYIEAFSRKRTLETALERLRGKK